MPDPDPVADYLRGAKLSDAQRATLWDAMQTAATPDDLATVLKPLAIPNTIKAELWDLKANATRQAVRTEDFLPPAPEGSALGRFASNVGAALNPITMATGLVDAVAHPIDTLGNIYNAGAAEAGKAAEAYRQGRYSEMVGHGVAAALPIVGPAAAAAGEQIGSGDIAGGLGAGTGLVGSIVAPAAVAKGARAVLPARAAVAGALEAGAEARVVDVMAPKVGRQKVRFGGMAEKVAPSVLQERLTTGAWSREGLQANVGAAFEESKAALDAAHDARLSARTFQTEPLIEALLEKRRALTAEAVEASSLARPAGISTTRTTMGVPGRQSLRTRMMFERDTPPTTTTLTPQGGPLGTSVVPGPNAPRVAMIDQALAELRALGPRARYEPLRRLRAAYDMPAEVTYNPAVTADFLTKTGSARGAADVTGTLREFLARHEPATAEANARFSLLKTADDVMEATREVERVRPAVGRKMLTSFLGGTTGGALGGVPGLAMGAVLGPVLDSAFAAGVTTKLQTARLMQDLATALRSGNPRAVASVGARLRARLPQLGPLLAQLEGLQGLPPAAPAATGTASTQR